MRRLALIIIVLGSLLTGSVLVLYTLGRAGLAAEEARLAEDARAGQRGLLEQIRKEIDTTLGDLLDREAATPYYHYQNLYVPPDAVATQLILARSPLAAEPQEELVDYYFEYRREAFNSPCFSIQNDPNPQATTPYCEDVSQKIVGLQTLQVAMQEYFAEPQASPAVEEAVDNYLCQSNSDIQQTLQDLEDAPKGKQTSKVQVEDGWKAYQSRQGNRWAQFGYGAQTSEPRTKIETPPPLAPEKVTVRVFPFRLLRQGLDVDGWPEHLLAVRRVEVDQQTWSQGFAIDLGQLKRTLVPQVIERAVASNQEVLSSYSLEIISKRASRSAPPAIVQLAPTRGPAGEQPDWVDPGQSDREGSTPETLPLLPPLEGLSLVHGGQTRDPREALRSSRLLLDGALTLVVCVMLLGCGILWAAARGQAKLAQQRADFVAALTHELKAPLTGVRALTELLHDGLVTDPVKQQEYYASMLSECDRLGRLIGNVLAASKLERGALPIALETLEPAALLEDLATRFGPRLETAGFRFEFDLPAEPLPTLLADREAFTQVVANLLDNAAKYGKGSTGNVVRLQASAAGGRLAVVVEDHGPGIAPAERERVFTRFFRSPNAPREVGGAGLGLAIARAQARAQGGDLVIDSAKGGGARFEFTLPIRQAL